MKLQINEITEAIATLHVGGKSKEEIVKELGNRGKGPLMVSLQWIERLMGTDSFRAAVNRLTSEAGHTPLPYEEKR